jgi:hypothetical protein
MMACSLPAMAAEFVACRCRAGPPAEASHHGTAPDGRPAASAVPRPCGLCGGSGRVSRGRLRAAGAARALFLSGLALAGLAAAAWLLGRARGPGSGAAQLGLAALAAIAVAVALELWLGRSVPEGG